MHTSGRRSERRPPRGGKRFLHSVETLFQFIYVFFVFFIFLHFHVWLSVSVIRTDNGIQVLFMCDFPLAKVLGSKSHRYKLSQWAVDAAEAMWWGICFSDRGFDIFCFFAFSFFEFRLPLTFAFVVFWVMPEVARQRLLRYADLRYGCESAHGGCKWGYG